MEQPDLTCGTHYYSAMFVDELHSQPKGNTTAQFGVRLHYFRLMVSNGVVIMLEQVLEQIDKSC